MGNIGSVDGLSWDNGKYNGNYFSRIGYTLGYVLEHINK